VRNSHILFSDRADGFDHSVRRSFLSEFPLSPQSAPFIMGIPLAPILVISTRPCGTSLTRQRPSSAKRAKRFANSAVDAMGYAVAFTGHCRPAGRLRCETARNPNKMRGSYAISPSFAR
jgi:hypothetical protein